MGKKVVVAAMIAFLGVLPVEAGGGIFGTVYTDDGDEFTGPIRWDRNEILWMDFLDASKGEDSWREGEESHLRIFGHEVLGFSSGNSWVRRHFSIPFGHVASIESMSRHRARILLKNGDDLVVRASSTDLGESMRGLQIEDDTAGSVELSWADVERVVFREGPDIPVSGLYGTLETERGEFTGSIVWDRDEATPGDILDGKRDGKKVKIPFADIEEIRRRDDRSCFVRLREGDPFILRGTNDVDSGNRGIQVAVVGMGQVEVRWREFQRLTLSEAPASPTYAQFDGGHKLFGTVTTSEGESHTGNIIWDEDEEYSWETLDGEADGVEYSVLFENLAAVERASGQSAEVTLTNGQELVLKGTNDVGGANKGIRIRGEDGTEITLDWDRFQRVEFRRP